MARSFRKKDPQGIYHIITKGISELKLFKNPKEKKKYLELVAKYRDIFNFKVYGFCIMDTHAHLIIGSNGADISKFMQGINGSYVGYFNIIHDREGHALKDRFSSYIIADDSYLLNASIYVHRNPKDIKEYADKIDKYKYSSLAVYINENFKDNSFMPVDTDLILALISSDKAMARKLYFEKVMKITNSEDNSIADLSTAEIDKTKNEFEYISGKKTMFRDVSPLKVIEYAAKSLNIKVSEIKIKYKKLPSKLRAISVLLLRCFCDLKLCEIGNIIGNLTTSQVSYLCNKGYKLIKDEKEYSNIMENFLEEFAT